MLIELAGDIMAKRTDSNQAQIVEVLRQVGASVQSLHTLGRGVPDLLVAYQGQTFLIECKTETGELTKYQKKWINTWQAPVIIAHTADEALKGIGVIP